MMDGTRVATNSLAAAAIAPSSGGARREGSVWSAAGTWSMSAASFGLATSGPSEPSGRFAPATLRFFFCCDFERGVGGGAPGTMRWAGGAAASDMVVEDVENDEQRATVLYEDWSDTGLEDSRVVDKSRLEDETKFVNLLGAKVKSEMTATQEFENWME